MTYTIVLDSAVDKIAAGQAHRRGISTEEYLTAQLTQMISQQEQTPPVPEREETKPEMAGPLEALLAQFQAEDPRAVLDPAREAYRANPMDAALVERGRRQGLNLS